MLDKLRQDFECCPFEAWEDFPRCCARSRTAWMPELIAFKSAMARSPLVEREFVLWLWEREWLIHVVPSSVLPHGFFVQITQKAPFVCSGPWFHATRAENVPRIDVEGLRPGCDTNVSTTTRTDAAHYVHVSISKLAALKWATGEQLLNLSDAVVYSIDPALLSSNRLFRDPCSQTGFVVDGFAIPPQALGRSSI